MEKFVSKHGGLTFTAYPFEQRFTVELDNGLLWEINKKPYIRRADGVDEEFPAPSYAEPFHSGTGDILKIVYTGFSDPDIVATAHAGVDRSTGDVVFSVNIEGDKKGFIGYTVYPGAFGLNAAPGHGYTVLSRMQGTVIPAGQPVVVETGLVFQRDAYMPIFGQVRDGSGYTAIFETPFDAKYIPDNDDICPAWLTTLGVMGYTRKMRYCFREKCDHNVIAKCYRQYVKERGGLVTLAEKEVRNPAVKDLIGLPVIHSGIAAHISPESMFYDKDHPENNDNYTTFDERAEQLRRLKSLGLDRAYTHFDGWGKHGYDNLHPSPFPPHEEAGGVEGMRRLSDTCRELGYIFGIHDQYRDYYYDNPDFSMDEVLTYGDGGHPYFSVWNGGRQTFLCSELAPDYVRRNYDEFERLGIRIDAAYLDVFSVVELDECFSPDHKCTREDCAKNRRHCLDMLTSRGIIPSSEEALDCIVPSLVLCHHAPFFTKVLGAPDSEAVGIPIPLFELVYHDCIIVPWIGLPGERGGWGIPKTDSAYVYAALYGCPVYCPADASAEDIENVKTACLSAKELAHAEMISHEFLDETFRKQRTTFSNGYVIEADLDSGEYNIIRG